jgi:NCS1 family nucleobase:cation symporter-1
MGAIAGIMICDYWILRKQRLNLAALFDPKGEYTYEDSIGAPLSRW